jgi:hypothetical protein
MKNLLILETQNEDSLHPRRLSYTLTSPIFDSNLLPKISADTSESDSDLDEDLSISNKSEKDVRNEIDKRSTSTYENFFEIQNSNHLKNLIEKQKHEYLVALEALRNKFTNEQNNLMIDLKGNLLTTSTPLNSSISPSTEDEEFTAFKTALQSQSFSFEEKTILNEEDVQVTFTIKFNCSSQIPFFM